ncbi:HPP family protein [Mesorhizobium sp. CAU 1732]|uniref:HPP family protein n=1 Tax=Mesorhizobium sp. CAU 1732 TaxID=3140358 RepID=UPI00325FFAE2
MREFLKTLLIRHEPPIAISANLRAGVAAIIGMSLVGAISAWTGLPLLLAPLGATAGLLFGQPSSPLSQPVNVMGGYLVGTIVCEGAFLFFPGEWIAVAAAVGLTIVLMRGLRVTHSPAAALPILGFGEPVHGLELFMVVFLSSVLLIALAFVVHRIPPRRPYPLPADHSD